VSPKQAKTQDSFGKLRTGSSRQKTAQDDKMQAVMAEQDLQK